MKIRILSLLLILVVISCQNSGNNANAKKVDQSDLLHLADTLELKEHQYDDLIDSVNTLNKKSDLFYRKIHIQKKQINNLTNENKILVKENKILTNRNKKPAISKQEKAIQNMVLKMHKAWTSLATDKKTDGLLAFFNPQFLVSRISIDVDDTASAARFSHEDFDEYLEETIIAVEGVSVEFAEVDFLDIEIKDNSYFNVAYKCVMGTYKNDRLLETNSLLVTITGKNIEGTWGISSYSWVNFKYGK